MTSIIDVLTLLKKQNDISKILVFNDLSLVKYDIIEIGKYVSSLYVSFYNNFALKNLSVQLRNIKNIHLVEANLIPNINYDMVCSYEVNNPIFLILSRIQFIKYFYCTNTETEIKVEIPGFKKDENIKNLYVRDSLTLVINEKKEDNISFNEELKIANIERISQNKPKKNNITTNNNYKNNDNKNIIVIKNIVSSLNQFSNFKEISLINYGELDICCILSNKYDYDLFLKTINYFNNNYSYVKYFIFLNGKTILKYFNEEKIKNLNYILIKLKNSDQNNISCLSIFELLFNGSYKFYMNEIDFNKEIIDLL